MSTAGPTTTVYGLKNCDTTRKARRWLQAHGIEHTFVDVRDDGVTAAQLRRWVSARGWEVVLNRRSTTWKSLGDAARAGLDEQRALALLAEHPTLIKRPVLESSTEVLVGFDAARYGQVFG